MSEDATGLAGRCLCGAVSFQISAAPQAAFHCCCENCRRSSGSGHATHVVIAETAFSLTGDVTFFAHGTDSGNTVTKAFCETCGSPIYSTNSGYHNAVFPRASVLDDPEMVRPQMVVYASRALSWDRLDDALPAFARMART